MDKTILNVKKEQCTGCGACYNKCPRNAIKMRYDNEGFLYPYIERELCVDCGLCMRVCPAGRKLPDKDDRRKYYAVWADEELRQNSSSGGMFTLLAQYILGLKGVVCGCRYSEDFQYAYHVLIESKDDLPPLRKSKYVQSEIRKVYSEIEGKLKEDRWVLFSGTPCQVAGLYSFLDNKYKKLLTVDIICHGVPSLKLYHKFLEENAREKEVECVDFRDKSIVPWGTVEFVKFKDSTYYYNDVNRGMYYKAFLNGLSTRKSCGSCKYANTMRQGDFTIGDFWGIKEICPEIDVKNGVSLVVVNSHTAHNFFKRVVATAQYQEIKEDAVLQLAKTRNGSLLHATPNHYARGRLFEMLDQEGYTQAIKKALYAEYDIGIVGWWYNLNYGGALTYYALHQSLRKMGNSVLMIDRTAENPDYRPDVTSIPYRFALKHYYISKNHPRDDMHGLNEHCEVFISGSDQLFNPVLWQWSGPEYFLHFVSNTRKKISYASSFGNRFQDIKELTGKMCYWLKRFDAVSVREDYGVDIAKDVFGIEAKKVLDPVFLCDKEEYINLVKQSKAEQMEHYFVNFILDPSEEKREIILYAEQKLKSTYINLINADHIEENEKKLNMKNTKANADIEDWLFYYFYSEFIITDSFHGTCFAIIFHKPFISIANTVRGERRFISLLTELGLMDRLVYNLEEIKQNDFLFRAIDYSNVDKVLEEKREDSLRWLQNAISSTKETSQLTDFQLLDDRISALEAMISKLNKKFDE